MNGNLMGLLVPLACGLMLSGCYTVLQSPYHSGGGSTYNAPSRDTETAPPETPSAAGEDQWQDLYRYPGTPPGYGGGYGSSYGFGGYPLVGGIGSHSASPYPYYNYYGYVPQSYGYDPYYRDRNGYYVSPGYKLITQAELDALQSTIEALQVSQALPDPQTAEQREQEAQRKAEESWERRTRPRMRSAPSATPRTHPAANPPAGRTTPPVTKRADSAAAADDSSANKARPSPAPRKRRR